MANLKAKNISITRGKDPSPKWDGCENWSTDQYYKHFRNSMDYYRLEFSSKDLKPKVINWMSANGYTKDQIKSFKDTKDYRCNSTMGGIAANLLNGMLPVRSDFNEGRNTAQWLGEQISKAIEEGKNDYVPETDEAVKNVAYVPNIQERLHETAVKMTEEIEDAIESFQADPEAFDPKAFKVSSLLRSKQVKAAHARLIKGFYEGNLSELTEASLGKDEQLKEAYRHLSKSQIKKIISFYQEVCSACDMLLQEAKVNKKPRAKRPTDKAKVVSKLKYQKTFEPLKLVSINPQDIIGSKELWIYNTKSRKLGKYIAAEYQELGVKGTSITGFDEAKSVQKTLRKPEDQIKEFKSAGKVQLRKFLEDIKAVDIKLNGRINEEVILLKVQ